MRVPARPLGLAGAVQRLRDRAISTRLIRRQRRARCCCYYRRPCNPRIRSRCCAIHQQVARDPARLPFHQSRLDQRLDIGASGVHPPPARPAPDAGPGVTSPAARPDAVRRHCVARRQWRCRPPPAQPPAAPARPPARSIHSPLASDSAPERRSPACALPPSAPGQPATAPVDRPAASGAIAASD